MRKTVSRKHLSVWICVLLAGVLAWAPAAFAGLTKITDNVYAYVDIKKPSAASCFGANAGIIIGRDGIVVVDTLLSAEKAKRFLKDVRAISKRPIKYVIDTHYHLDHAFGNSEFAKQGGIIIAHENDKQNLRKNGDATLKNIKSFGISEKEMRGTKIALPSLTYERRMVIDLGDQKVELQHLGPAHTSGDTIVYLPDKKVLFAGDVLFTNYHPFMAEGDLESWAKVLDGILAMDVDIIIPGHGPLSTKQEIAAMKAYLVLFDNKARELCAQSSNFEYVYSELMKVLPVKESSDFLVGANIRARYLK